MIGRDVSIIDVPIVYETSYDYDDMEGVIDDRANPYDQTEPILVSLLDILGGKCKVCSIKNPILLSIRSINNSQKSSKQLKELAEKMIQYGKDPSKEICILCYNCNVLRTKIINSQRSLGLPESTLDELKQELRN